MMSLEFTMEKYTEHVLLGQSLWGKYKTFSPSLYFHEIINQCEFPSMRVREFDRLWITLNNTERTWKRTLQFILLELSGAQAPW